MAQLNLDMCLCLLGGIGTKKVFASGSRRWLGLCEEASVNGFANVVRCQSVSLSCEENCGVRPFEVRGLWSLDRVDR